MSIIYQFLSHTYLLMLLSCNSTDVPLTNIAQPTSNLPMFEGKIMQSKDGGQTWVNIYNDIPQQPDIRSVNVSENRLLIGSEKGALYVSGQLMDKNVWKNENLKEMCIDQSIKDQYFVSGIFNTKSATYANIMYDGLYKKQYGSAHWMPIKLPDDITFINDIKEDDKGQIYIACQQGLFYSKDKGNQWEKIYHLSWVTSLSIQENIIIAACYDGMYSSYDNGAHWSKTPLIENPSLMNIGSQPNHYTAKYLGGELVAIREESRNQIGNAGKVQCSKDGGKSWQLHTSDNYIKNLAGVYSLKEYNGKLYCSYSEGLIMSSDNGKTWKQLLKYDASNKSTTLGLFVTDGALYCVEVSIGC